MSTKSELSLSEKSKSVDLLKKGIAENGLSSDRQGDLRTDRTAIYSTVHGYLKKLEQKGYIITADDKPGAITLTGNEDFFSSLSRSGFGSSR